MNDKIMLGEFIYKLRKEKFLSQAELGAKVGVSNKAVSKWETDEANPDLGIIKKLAEVLGVTADELLACKRCANDTEFGRIDSLFGIKGVVTKTSKSYEFVSEKKTAKGTPYAHINLGLDERGRIRQAKGLISVGIIAKGLISCGVISVGLVSVGVLCLGLIAVGALCLGLLIAVGAVAAGMGISVGGVAIGTLAVGGIAVGVMSVGGFSVGVFAHTGEFGKAIGLYTFLH